MIKNMRRDRHIVERYIKFEEGKKVEVANLDGLRNFEEIRHLSDYEKCIVLINTAELFDELDEINFEVLPENIFFDAGLTVKIRDYSMEWNQNNASETLKKYKALIGSVFGSYAFEDYIQGGEDLYEKSGSVKDIPIEIFKMKSVDEIRRFLTVCAGELKKEADEKYVLMPKNKARIYKKAMPALIAVSTVCIILSGYLFFFDHSKNEKIIDAYGYYIAGEYEKVAEETKNMSLSNMPYETKVIVAKSYVSMESFTDKNASVQREKINSNINTATDEKYLCYWIEIGRLNFDSAIDYAKQLSDDELLYYALIKQKDAVNKDNNMSGSEKEEKLKDINSQIDGLKEKLNGAAGSNNTNTTNETNGEIKLDN